MTNAPAAPAADFGHLPPPPAADQDGLCAWAAIIARWEALSRTAGVSQREVLRCRLERANALTMARAYAGSVRPDLSLSPTRPSP